MLEPIWSVLAQSLVVPIVVYWARVTIIPDAMITSMQTAIMKFVWKNYFCKNQQARNKKSENRVQQRVGDKGVFRRRADGACHSSTLNRWSRPTRSPLYCVCYPRHNKPTKLSLTCGCRTWGSRITWDLATSLALRTLGFQEMRPFSIESV